VEIGSVSRYPYPEDGRPKSMVFYNNILQQSAYRYVKTWQRRKANELGHLGQRKAMIDVSASSTRSSSW